MKKDKSYSGILACALALCIAPAFTGCSDSDFDLSKVDTTVGIGSDGLQLPTSDTEDIKLDDVLKLNNSDLVYVDDNGDYMFRKAGDGMTPSHPHVNGVTVAVKRIDNSFRVDVPSSAFAAPSVKSRRKGASADEVNVEGKTSEFHFRGAAPNDIREASSAEVEAEVSVKVNVSDGLKRLVPTFKTLKLSFPSFMKLRLGRCYPSQPDYDEAAGTLVFHNVASTADIRVNATLVQLDFKKAQSGGNALKLTPGKGNADGEVTVDGTALMGVSFGKTTAAVPVSSQLHLTSVLTMSDIKVLKVTGKFNPELRISDFGSVAINSVPDFLSDGKVSVNLYNPTIELTVNNGIDVAGTVRGTLVAEGENGSELARVGIPQMRINASGQTKICICKRADGVDRSVYDEVKEVPQLSEVLRTIPKRIRFEADASADATREGTVELGRTYDITSNYSVFAPLAFDEGARIVYSDVIDGWNDDLDDISLADGAYVELSAKIENRIPAYLTITAHAVDVDGNEIPQNRVKVDVNGSVKASEDGATAAVSPITVQLRETESGAVKSVDGIAFRVEAASGEEGSKSIVGKTVNARKQTLTARDIKVKLVGRVIADLN